METPKYWSEIFGTTDEFIQSSKVIYNSCCTAVDTDILWQNADLVYVNMLFCVYYSLDQSERP